MLLILTYLIALGVSTLTTRPELLIICFIYLFKLKTLYLDKILICLFLSNVILFVFNSRDISQLSQYIIVLTTSIIICNYFIKVREITCKYIYYLFCLTIITIYFTSYLLYGDREFAIELIGIGSYHAHFLSNHQFISSYEIV